MAVLGALLGAVVAGLIQHCTTRAARDAERVDRRRDQALEAVTALATRRRAQFVREELRLAGADETRLDAAHAEPHITRAANETPRVLVAIFLPTLAPVVDAAAQASYALRDAPDADALTALRQDGIAMPVLQLG
ncbi:protein kilB [Streptomyces sp. NPDC056528]|uniref:protein kilB n=1 Tax=Streptomyces sp. NPDC056528 TaxID=3345854 RepID=UPI0036BC73A4